MPSYDKTWRIERYDNYNLEGKIDSFDFGCPDLDLMGFSDINELCHEIASKVAQITLKDLHNTNLRDAKHELNATEKEHGE